MAIEIKSNTGAYDCFETKCPHCGRELTYSRKNIRAHHRWPNGFIYCPCCKNPVGHDESNLLAKGEDELKKIASLKGTNAEELEKQIKVLRTIKTVMFSVGIPILVLGAILFTISILPTPINNIPSQILTFLVFNLGLSMTISGGILSKILTEKQMLTQVV